MTGHLRAAKKGPTEIPELANQELFYTKGTRITMRQKESEKMLRKGKGYSDVRKPKMSLARSSLAGAR
jgi:hypothetical protein